jgi:cytochrome b561
MALVATKRIAYRLLRWKFDTNTVLVPARSGLCTLCRRQETSIMRLRSTSTDYGSVAKLLHWVSAALILFMFGFGWWMTHMLDRPARVPAYALHGLIGIYLLVLMVIRVLWRLSEPTPALPADTVGWERIAARAGHLLLYAVVLVSIVTGYLLWSSFARREPLVLIGGLQIPFAYANPDRAISHSWEDIHEVMSKVVIGLVMLHVAAALRHHFVKRNDVLARMGFGTRSRA